MAAVGFKPNIKMAVDCTSIQPARPRVLHAYLETESFESKSYDGFFHEKVLAYREFLNLVITQR